MKEIHKLSLILPDNFTVRDFQDIIQYALKHSDVVYDIISYTEKTKKVTLKDLSLNVIAGGKDSGILFELEEK